jgi:type I restriction enzyme S subunit
MNLNQYSTSAAQPGLSVEMINALMVPCPPQKEQTAIATFLDRETAKIDALIAEQQRLIELLQEKRQAVISHAVTKGLNPNAPMKDSGVEWLGEVPEHWSVCAVGHRYEVRLGKMLDEKRITGQFPGPYLRNTDVQWESINTEELPEMDFEPSEHERYSLKEGDLLVCEGGEVGRCAIWEAELPICFYQKALHRLRPLDPSLDNPRFQLCIMRMACSKGVFEASSGKATINHLTAEAFRRYRFAYPPAHEQHSISEYLSGACEDLNALQKEAQSLVGKLQERRSSLISAAVTGQIDVRGLVEAEAGEQ